MLDRALMSVERLLNRAANGGTPLEQLEGRMLMSGVAPDVDMSDQPRLAPPVEVVSPRQWGMGIFGSHGARASVGLTLPVVTSITGTAKSVVLKWSGIDATATTVTVQRSPDGVTWTSFAVSKSAVGYTDTSVSPGAAYFYRVMVKGPASSIASKSMTVKAALATPTATVTISGSTATLKWSDTNPSSVSYQVYRSKDGVSFALVKSVAAGAAKSFSESISSGSTFTYRVRAVFQTKVSADSAKVVAKAAAVPASTATIAWRYGTELVITSPASDTISVAQSGGSLLVTIAGVTSTLSMPKGLFIYDRGGTDTITVASSVSVRTTITALSGAATKVSSSGSNVSLWLDSSDSFTGSGSVHWVSSFAGGVSKATGASLANPSDAGAVWKMSGSLWGAAPAAEDINQGAIGDCYFLASIAGMALESPAVLMETAVDLGDGTYVVQMYKSGSPQFIRVSNEVSQGPWGGYLYAHPGASGAVWGAVLEKAWAYSRTGANTYASTSAGWMEEAFRAMGVKATSFSVFMGESSFYSLVSGSLSSGQAVTIATEESSKLLVGGHAYTVVGAYLEGGKSFYQVRNPWGVGGTTYESKTGYAVLSFDQIKSECYAGVRVA